MEYKNFEYKIDESELINEGWSIDDLMELIKKAENQSGKKYNLMGMCGLEKMYRMFFLSGQEECIDLAQRKVNFKNEAQHYFNNEVYQMNVSIEEATEEYMKWDKHCIELVGNGYIWDQVTNAIVLSVVKDYFLGEQSIEETTAKLEDKVTAWLNE